MQQPHRITDVISLFALMVSGFIALGSLLMLNDAMLLKNEGYFSVPQLPALFWIIVLVGINIAALLIRNQIQLVEYIKITTCVFFVAILVIAYKFSKRHVMIELALLSLLVSTSLFTLLNILSGGQKRVKLRATVWPWVFCILTAVGLLLFFLFPVRQGKVPAFNLYIKNENFDASVKVQNIYLSGAFLEGCNFNETIFSDVDFIEADIRRVSFRECKLEHTTFDNSVFANESTFDRCLFTDTRFLENVEMPKISFAGSTFENKTLLDGNYEGADFRCCKFRPGVIIPHLERFDGRYIELIRMIGIDGIGSITSQINDLPHMDGFTFDCSMLPDGEVVFNELD